MIRESGKALTVPVVPGRVLGALHATRGPLCSSLGCFAALAMLPQAREIVRTLALDVGSEEGAITVAFVNHVDSPLAKAAEYVVPLFAGEEKAVEARRRPSGEAIDDIDAALADAFGSPEVVALARPSSMSVFCP